MNIVLLEPEIPQNAGNIARTCAVTNSTLHLIKPLGFSVDDKYLKRAGLDYWHYLDIRYYENWQDFLSLPLTSENPPGIPKELLLPLHKPRYKPIGNQFSPWNHPESRLQPKCYTTCKTPGKSAKHTI